MRVEQVRVVQLRIELEIEDDPYGEEFLIYQQHHHQSFNIEIPRVEAEKLRVEERVAVKRSETRVLYHDRSLKSPVMSRVGPPLTCSVLLTLTLLFSSFINGSEFPERECCDPIYPIPEPTSKAPSVSTPTGRSGESRCYTIFIERLKLTEETLSHIYRGVSHFLNKSFLYPENCQEFSRFLVFGNCLFRMNENDGDQKNINCY